MSRIRSVLPVALVFALATAFLGCSDSTNPSGTPSDGTRDFQGSIDPTARSFVLKSIDSTGVGGIRIRVDLIGSNLRVDPDLLVVSLDVAVRNLGQGPLHAPGEIDIHDIAPPMVWVLNADRVDCPPRMGPGIDSRLCRFAFDYSTLLGDDLVLSPGETSGAKRWSFRVPGLTGFSFGATARFGLEPGRPRIEGTVWSDGNANGVREPEEPGFGGGTIVVNGPGLDSLVVMVPESGHYVVPVTKAGLYVLLAVPPPTFAAVRPTTPNPLQVLLPPGPDGLPESYLHADFGFANEIPPPPGEPEPVRFWEGPADSLQLDPYTLLDIRFDGPVVELELHVGFSGCGPLHPFGLYMVGGFQESTPVQANIVLSHDDHGEMCDAWFERTRRYDLTPILQEYRRIYGENGEVIVNFQAWNGEVHSFRIGGMMR